MSIDKVSTRSIESIKIISSSIQDGDIDVEVGRPIELILSLSDVGTESLKNSLNLKSSDNFNIPYRIDYLNNKTIIIPQIKMTPGELYTLSLNDTEINFRTKNLDFGLYWFGKNGLCEKYYPEYNNIFYDNEKPTMFYIHGWQNNSVSTKDYYGRKNFQYEQFNWKEEDFQEWTNNSWIENGWNTGIIYWNQFADDEDLYSAEEKIWNLTAENAKYKTVENGQVVDKTWNRLYRYNKEEFLVTSITELLSIPVIDIIKSNHSGNIRMVGHSLGNQLAVSLSHRVAQEGYKITRLALLDPAWTSFDKDYLPYDVYGKWTGERTRNYIFELLDQNNLDSVEVYHTTALNTWTVVTDSNDSLMERVCNVDLAPWYYGSSEIEKKHIVAASHYFLSMSSLPPVECTISWWQRSTTGLFAPSASTSDERIRDMMLSNYKWVQVEGRYTYSASDDWFERKDR